MTGRVSVVLTTYYRNEQLRAAIESVRRQTYDSIRVLVVDGSGEAHARPVAAEYDVDYLAQDEDRGVVGARNAGIRATDGEYVQFLDDDDRIRPRKIETQVALLESDPGAGVAYGGVVTKAGDEVYPDPACRDDPLRCALQIIYPGTFPSSMLIERDVLEAIAPLKRRPSADDIGWTIELARRTDFAAVDEVLTDIGRSEDHDSDSIEFPLEVRKIIREYDHLYECYPPAVRHAALSFMYESLAIHALDDRWWSPTAPVAYLKAAYHGGAVSSPRPVLLAAAAASLFGRPGVDLASRARELLSRSVVGSGSVIR